MNIGSTAILCASAVCIASPAFANDCPTDLNHDRTTDGRDLAMLLGGWNTTDYVSDINADGMSNAVDLALLLENWGLCLGEQSITSVAPHFVAPGASFVVLGIDPGTVTEVLLDGESIDFNSDAQLLSAEVPASSTEGGRTLVLVTNSGLHRVVNGITVSEELDGNYTTYVPTFSNEGSGCNSQVADLGPGLVNFEGKGGPNRACSNQAYTGITKITADIDLSDAKGRKWNNASFYLISNPDDWSKQPLNSGYCDRGNLEAGINANESGGANCREIDFLETNGAAITQSTEHLRNTQDDGFAQRWEESWTAEAVSNSCYSPSPATGGHDIASFDLDQPIQMVATFDTSAVDEKTGATPPTRMKVTFAQGGNTITVYDSQGDAMGEEGGSISSSDLTTQIAGGFWLLVSWHQDYSPSGPAGSWWDGCSWDANCGSAPFPGWKLNNISVVGNGTVGG